MWFLHALGRHVERTGDHDGAPVTQRAGKPVEVNALWIDGLLAAARIASSVGDDARRFAALAERATVAFERGFDAVAAVGSTSSTVSSANSADPSRWSAAAVLGPMASPGERRAVLGATESLRTSIGLRSLSPIDAQYT